MAIPAGVIERTQRHEEGVLWPYLDAAEEPKVTIGFGHMVPNLDAFQALPLVGPDSATVADETAKKVAWDAIQFMVAEQRERTDPKKKFAAAHYESATSVRMPLAEATKLLSADLDKAVRALQSQFPAYDTYPDPAKAALIDLMYNIGATKFVKQKWPSLFAAVLAVPPHWKVAAAESNRKPPISAERNREIKELFEEAAVIQGAP